MRLTASKAGSTARSPGAGIFSLGGGSADAINTGTSITSSGWTITDAGTDATLNEVLSYSGTFMEQSGATLTLAKELTLTGSASFANATVNGSGKLTIDGPTSVTGAVTFASGVTLAGTGLVSIGSTALSMCSARSQWHCNRVRWN